jgi:hypothetical protein
VYLHIYCFADVQKFLVISLRLQHKQSALIKRALGRYYGIKTYNWRTLIRDL